MLAVVRDGLLEFGHVSEAGALDAVLGDFAAEALAFESPVASAMPAPRETFSPKPQ